MTRTLTESDMLAMQARGREQIEAANVWSEAAREASAEARHERSIAHLNQEMPTSQKQYEIKPTPELEKKIVSATDASTKKIDDAVGEFAKSGKSAKDWDVFTKKVKEAKTEFESNSDKNTDFLLRIAHSSGGNGAKLSESTYATYEVSDKESGESYFNTDTARFSRHRQH